MSTPSRSIIPILVMTAFASSAYAQMLAAQENGPAPLTTVFVSTIGGTNPVRGTLLRLDGRSIVLLVDGQSRELPFDDVAEIDVPHRSVRTGFIIGAAIGGLLSAAAFSEGFENGGQAALAVAFNAGFFGLTGAGINALHETRTPIYLKSPKAGGTAALAPSIGVKFRF